MKYKLLNFTLSVFSCNIKQVVAGTSTTAAIGLNMYQLDSNLVSDKNPPTVNY